VSGLLATQTPGPFTTLQARVKGETEILLSKQVTQDFHIEAPRPGAVDPSGHTAILPFIPDAGMLAKTARAVAIPVMSQFSGLYSPSEELGQYLMEMAMGRFDDRLDEEQATVDVPLVEGGLRVVTNKAMRRWMVSAKTEGSGFQ
jgi:hypothetical protein